MDELKRSVDYSRKRLQAIRNCEGHVADILWKTTQKVITASKRYRGAGRLTNESALLSYAKNVTAEAEESIKSYISAYSKASCKILGIDSITKAKRKDINIDVPSYGKGYYRNAYQNIVRNASQVIALAWGQAEQEYGQESGAVGYFVHRGSSYNCPVCDDLCGYIHPLDTMVIPAHPNCACRVELVFRRK